MQGQSNGTPVGRKQPQVLFSIGSYSERNKRVINKISANGSFLKKEQPTGPKLQERPASLDATDSVKHTQTLPNLRKFKPFQSLVDESLVDDRLIIVERNGDPEKPSCPPSNSLCFKSTDGPVDKPSHPPKMISRSLSLETEQLRHSGKVALTIAAYEGEPRTPTRLDFLPSQPKLSRSSSKASDASSSLAVTPLEEEARQPIGSRLQNELVATLRRSNLKKRHDQHIATETPPPSPAALAKHVDFEDNEIMEKVEIRVKQGNGSVRKVAAALEESLTFGVNSKPMPIQLPNEILKKQERDTSSKNDVVEEQVNVDGNIVAAELSKEEKREEQRKSSEKARESVVRIEETRVGDDIKIPEKHENSIQKSLADAFDEIIILADNNEEKS